ncbi:MAG: hypothetical protein AAFR57_09595 [Pseudomonadota bacterium]
MTVQDLIANIARSPMLRAEPSRCTLLHRQHGIDGEACGHVSLADLRAREQRDVWAEGLDR